MSEKNPPRCELCHLYRAALRGSAHPNHLIPAVTSQILSHLSLGQWGRTLHASGGMRNHQKGTHSDTVSDSTLQELC